MMKNLGFFTRYEPEIPPYPGAMYLKNESDVDWYSIAWDSERIAGNIYLATDNSGRVCSVTNDASELCPLNLTVWEMPLSEAPADILESGYGATIIDGVLTGLRPVAEQRAAAEKNRLLATASDAIAPLQDAVELEIATDKEIAQLGAWKKYRVMLNRVDTSTAPDIEWPEAPDDVA